MRVRQKAGRQYLINLHRWRSRLALLACSLSLIAAVGSVVGGMMEFVKDGLPAAELFRYFTPNAGVLAGLAVAFIIPYAVEGIRHKRFTYPRWVALLHYSGTICSTLTMLFSVTFIAATDPQMAFGGNNLALHVICPTLTLLCFLLVETGYRFTVRDALLCQLPVPVYSLIYFFRVRICGEEGGGWPDLYHIMEHMHPLLALILILLFSAAVAYLIRHLNHRLAGIHHQKLTALWQDGLEPVEVKVEVYGLGRLAAKNDEESDVHLPMDTLRMLSARYGIPLEELLRAYTLGVMHGFE